MKIFLPVALMIFTPITQGERIDFQQALQRALEKSPTHQSLRISARNAELSEQNAWRVFFPTVDLQASHSYTRQSGVSNATHSPWANQLGLSVTENLYDNGDSWRLAEIASLNRRVEALNLESGRNRLLVTVAKAYYDFSSAFESVELQKRQIEALNTQFRTIDARYQQGLRSNRDYLRIKSQVQSAEISLLSQQMTLDNMRSTLRLVIGESFATEFIHFNAGLLNLTQMEFPAVDVEQSYEYQMARMKNQMATLKYESIRRIEWPRLSLKGSYNYVIPQYIGPRHPGADDPFWNLSAMLILDYRLWDWGRTHRSVEIAAALRDSEGLTQKTMQAQVEHNLANLQKQAPLLKRSFKMSGEILRTNEAAFLSLNRGYFDGKVSYLELITGLNDLYSSRSQELNLRFNILKLRAELAYAQGNVDAVLKTP